MAKQLTADDAKQSLTAHVETKGIEIYVKYGPQIGWAELQRLLTDRALSAVSSTATRAEGPREGAAKSMLSVCSAIACTGWSK